MRPSHIAPRRIERTGDDTPARTLLRYVWRMSGQHQVWVCLLGLVIAGLSMVPLELQRQIINNAVDNRNVRLLVVLGALYLAVLLLQGGLKFALRVYQGWLSESAVRYNRAHLARLHRRQNDDAGDDEGQGKAVSVIATEIDKLGGFVGDGLSQPVVNLGMLVTIAGYMLVVDPLVAVFSFLFLIPQAVIVPLVQGRINRLVEKRLTLMRDLSEAIVHSDEERKEAGDDRFPTKLDGIYANRMKIFVIKSGLKSVVNLLNGLAPLSVLLVGGYLALQGETTIGVVVAFMSGFDRLANPLREMLAYYRTATQTNVQHRMIADWM